MASIRLQPLPMIPPVEATARYEPADYSLIVGPQGRIPPALHRLSIDTLTLSFTPDKHVWVGLDAYTNAARWERRPLANPPIDQDAALMCLELFDEHGIAEGSTETVRYAYSEEAALLLLRISDGQIARRIRYLSCSICGLGADGELMEIWVQGLNL
jgi:hypothetical protein